MCTAQHATGTNHRQISQVTVLLDANYLVKYTLECQQINTFTELSSLHASSFIYLLYLPILPLLGIVIFHYVNPPFPLSLSFVVSSTPHVPFTHFRSFFLPSSLCKCNSSLFFLYFFLPSFPPTLLSLSHCNHNNSISREFFYVVSCIPRSSQRLIFSLLPVLPVQLTITTST